MESEAHSWHPNLPNYKMMGERANRVDEQREQFDVGDSFSRAQNPASPPSSSIAVPKSSDRDEVSLLDLLLAVAECRNTLIFVPIGFIFLAIAISFLVPARYTATAILLTPKQDSFERIAFSSEQDSASSNFSSPGTAIEPAIPINLGSFNDIWVSLLTSRTVEDAIVRRFDLTRHYHVRLTSDARRVLGQNLTVDGSRKDRLIYIAVNDPDSKFASELANGYVDEFRKLTTTLAVTAASQHRLFLQQQLRNTKENLVAAEEAMKESERTTGLFQADAQASSLLSAASSLRAQIATKEVQIQSMRISATDQNPELIRGQRELQGLRAQLAELGREGNSSASDFIISQRKLPEAHMEYLRRQRDVNYYETFSKYLAEQLEIAILEEARQGATVQFVEPAVPPERRAFPVRGILVKAYGFVGAITGLFIAMLQIHWRNIKADLTIRPRLLRLFAIISFNKRQEQVL